MIHNETGGVYDIRNVNSINKNNKSSRHWLYFQSLSEFVAIIDDENKKGCIAF